MKKLLWLAFAPVLMTGCASVVNETIQPMKVETKNSAGDIVAGADCKLDNDYGTFRSKSGDTVLVHRSNKDLQIVCQHPENLAATARAISRANAGLAGNILIGGGIGAIIDHNRGTAYTYPTWVQLVFGQTLVFDRADEKSGLPVAADPNAAVAAK